MFRTACVCCNERQINLRGGHAGKLDLRFFGGFFQALHGHFVAGKVNAVRLFKFGNHPIYDALVEIVAAEVVVARRGENFLDAVTHLNDRNIKRAAAEVVNHHFLVFALVNAVGKCRSRRFVDDALNIQSGNLAGIFGRLALRIRKIGRYGDYCRTDGFAQVRFCIRLQFLKDHGRNFLRRKILAVYADFIIRTHLSFDGSNRAVRVGDCLAFCHLADHALPGFRKCNDGRRRARTFRIWYYNRLAALYDSHTGIGCAKVNADCL